MDIIKVDDKRLDVIKKYLDASFIYEYDDIKSSDLLIPIKGIDDFGNIKDSSLNIYKILEKKKIKRLFVANMTNKLKEIRDNYNIEVIPLFEFPDVLEYNSYLTAEGLLSIIIQKTDFNLRDSRVLLLGYGNCGKQIYKLFKSITRIDVNNYDCIEKYDIIINTVPKLVLDKKLLKRVNGIIFDISSFPYGIDIDYAKEMNVRYFIEPIIPARYHSYDAGMILAKKINEILN